MLYVVGVAMSMTRGSVIINSTTGAVSGTGFAKELWDEYAASISFTPLTGEQLAQARQRVADLVNAISLIVTHIKTNGQAKIGTGDNSLQRLPAAPMSENDPTKGPAAAKYLDIV